MARRRVTLSQILLNSDAPQQAKVFLNRRGNIVPFYASSLPHKALRGHVDLFLSQKTADSFVVAPNAPEVLKDALRQSSVTFSFGNTEVGKSLSSLGAYNIAVGGQLAVGNERYCDAILLEALRKERCRFVHTKQGMARCSAVVIGGKAVITSDGGIYKALANQGVETLLVSAKEIVLPGYANGCFGGCCGVDGNTIFFMGSLQYHPQGKLIREFLHVHNMAVVELYGGPLTDVGSFFFL